MGNGICVDGGIFGANASGLFGHLPPRSLGLPVPPQAPYTLTGWFD